MKHSVPFALARQCQSVRLMGTFQGFSRFEGHLDQTSSLRADEIPRPRSLASL